MTQLEPRTVVILKRQDEMALNFTAEWKISEGVTHWLSQQKNVDDTGYCITVSKNFKTDMRSSNPKMEKECTNLRQCKKLLSILNHMQVHLRDGSSIRNFLRMQWLQQCNLATSNTFSRKPNYKHARTSNLSWIFHSFLWFMSYKLYTH